MFQSLITKTLSRHYYINITTFNYHVALFNKEHLQKYLFIRKISTPLKRIKIHSRISFQKLSQTNAQLYTIFSSLKCHRNNTDERGSEKKKNIEQIDRFDRQQLRKLLLVASI